MAYETQMRFSSTQNVVTNSSHVVVYFDFKRTDKNYFGHNMFEGQAHWEIKCDGRSSGRQYFTFNWNIPKNTWKEVGRAEFDIPHNSDGTKTITMSGYVNFGADVEPGSLSGSSTNQLPRIGRASAISVDREIAPMGEQMVISISRQSNSFTHKISYHFGNDIGSISENATTVAYWTPPLHLATNIPNNTIGQGTLTCETYNAGSLVGSTSLIFKLIVPDSVVPTVSSINVSDASGYMNTYGVFIQRKSIPQVSISANGAYGSTIQTYQTTIENKTYEGSSFTGNLLNNSGNITISTLILDSRGRSSTKTTTINSSSYSSPTISSFSVERCDSNGAFNTKGTYVKVICTGSITNVNGRNNNHYVVQYKLSSSSSWMNLISGYAYSININQVKTISGGFLATSSYDFRFTVTDSFSSNTIERKAQTSFTLINWSENGKGFSVGKVSEKDAFEVALPSEFTNTVDFSKEVNTNNTVNMLGETNIKTLNTTGEYSMSSGKLKDQIKKENVGANWIKARDNATIVNTVSSNNNFHAISSMKTPLGSWNIGTLGENLVFSYDTDSNYRADINETTTFMLNQWGVDSIDKQLSYTYNGAPITISLRKNDKMVFCAISWVGTAETNKVIQFTGLKLDRDWSPNNTVTVYTPSISASSIVPEKTGTTFKIHSDGTINVITNESRYVERIVSTSWII